MQRYKEKETLKNLYSEHKNIRKVAEVLKVNEKTIAIWMKKHGIKNFGSQGARKHNLNHDFFKEINSEEKAYWLGFILADGCVYKGSGANSFRLQINLKGSDIVHLEKFQKSIESSYKIQEKKIKNSNVCLLKINSTTMCKDLINLNIVPKKSLIAKMPDIENRFKKDLIRGYFDGDGCIDVYRKDLRMRVVGTENVLTSIQKSLNEQNIHSKLYSPLKNQKIFTLEINRKKDALKFAKWIYDDSTHFLERKKKVYENFNICPL